MGAANKVSGNKIRVIKVLKKKVLSLEKMSSSLRRFHLSILCILNIARGVFNIKSLFFHGCKHPLFQCIFHFQRTFFPTTFCIKSYWNQKKSQKIKSQIGRTLFPEIFFQELFSTGFFQCQNLGLYFRKHFEESKRCVEKVALQRDVHRR